MPRTVDARGLPCPKPVLQTRAALQESDEVLAIVDNEISRNNVMRMAESKGYTVVVQEKEGDFYLAISRAGAGRERPRQVAEKRETEAAGPLVLLLGSDEMGRGVPELGNLLMRTFLQTVGELDSLPAAIVCLNSGVKLAVEGASTVGALQVLKEAGVQLLVCGTCLDYFQVKDKLAVGEVSNMFTIAETLTTAGNVITF